MTNYTSLLKMPVERSHSIESAVQKFITVMKVCTDEQFLERIDIMNKLCEIWEIGEDVDLRCNEPDETASRKNEISHSDESRCWESSSPPTNHVPKTKQIAKYRAPVMPRRKPGETAVPFDCSVCGKSFRFYSQLQQHSRHHAGVRPFECKTCGQSFALQCSLTKHSTVHSKEKPLMCDTCGQRFAHVNYLKSHQLTHQRKQLYACQECSKAFTTAGSLRHHIAVAHSESVSDSPEHQFSCDKCGETFTSLVLVRQHLDAHLKIDADGTTHDGASEIDSFDQTDNRSGESLCDKVLGLPTKSVTVHAGVESEHQCEDCGQHFLELVNLKAHIMRLHATEMVKTFACQLCDKRFSNFSTLRRHISSHSPVLDSVTSMDTGRSMPVTTMPISAARVDSNHDSNDFYYGASSKSANCV